MSQYGRSAAALISLGHSDNLIFLRCLCQMRQDSLLIYILKTAGSPTDLKIVNRHTVLRAQYAYCARAVKSICLSVCLLVCLFVCNKITLAYV